ncbi:DUF4190 domain-containing protein [Streptomyces sp. NPDC006512]|uniref:DUF4190 domain-containing protein n=1 Tax=Streptomyces sp. NPDC006512 TaxID=3154307 RepID=UPI0033AE8B77
MTDHSPQPRDPWAPPEQPAVDLGKTRGTPGGAAAGAVPPVHDQPTLTGMPGAPEPAPYAPTPPYGAPQTSPPGTGQTPAYGYPAQPDTYGYPAQPDPGGPAYQGAPPGYPGYAAPGPAGLPYPGYPGYAYPGYAPPVTSGLAVTALVLGILSVLACVTVIGSIALGIAAVVFGVVGRGKANRGQAGGGGMALAGIILGAVGIVLGVVLGLLVAFSPADYAEDDRDGNTAPSVSEVRERV